MNISVTIFFLNTITLFLVKHTMRCHILQNCSRIFKSFWRSAALSAHNTRSSVNNKYVNSFSPNTAAYSLYRKYFKSYTNSLNRNRFAIPLVVQYICFLFSHQHFPSISLDTWPDCTYCI